MEIVALIIGIIIGFGLNYILHRGRSLGDLNITENNEIYLSLLSEEALAKLPKQNTVIFTVKRIKTRNNQSL